LTFLLFFPPPVWASDYFEVFCVFCCFVLRFWAQRSSWT
jgi:hypothetical protein